MNTATQQPKSVTARQITRLQDRACAALIFGSIEQAASTLRHSDARSLYDVISKAVNEVVETGWSWAAGENVSASEIYAFTEPLYQSEGIVLGKHRYANNIVQSALDAIYHITPCAARLDKVRSGVEFSLGTDFEQIEKNMAVQSLRHAVKSVSDPQRDQQMMWQQKATERLLVTYTQEQPVIRLDIETGLYREVDARTGQFLDNQLYNPGQPIQRSFLRDL